MFVLIFLIALLFPPAAYAVEALHIDDDAYYPEGPLWVGDTLYYAEMERDRITVWSDGEKKEFWSAPGCGPTSVAVYKRDQFVVTCHLTNSVVVVSSAGKTIREIDSDPNGNVIVHPNDSTADDAGGVYFSASGDFSPTAPAIGKVFYLASDGALTLSASGLHYSNGVVFDKSRGRLFVSEHLARHVDIFSIQSPGRLGQKETFVTLSELERAAKAEVATYPLAGPDGLELDGNGQLYIAEYGEGRIWVVDSRGKFRDVIKVPMPFVTSSTIDAHGRIAVTGPMSNDIYPYVGKVLLIDPTPHAN